MWVDFACFVGMHVNEVQANNPGVIRLPELRGMKNPEALAASQVQDVGGRFLAEIVKRRRVRAHEFAQQLVCLVIAVHRRGVDGQP